MSAVKRLEEQPAIRRSSRDNIIYLNKYRKEVKVNWQSTAYTLLCILFFVFVCIIYLRASFLLVRLNVDHNTLKYTYKNLVEENEILQDRLRKQANLDEVRKVAVDELGMRPPKASEVHTIKHRKKSYTIILNKKQNYIDKKSLEFSSFLSFLKEVFWLK